MANLIPSLNSCLSRMQSGEKRFARRLESHLEDDYLCWYELPVGKRQRYSDFIILHPQRGILLLEVKDWKLQTLQRINKTTATITTPQGPKVVSNPLEQVRQCTYQLINRLQRDPQLVNQSGRFRGQLCFPYGYGVVLTNMSRRQFDASDMGEVLPQHQTLCQDEMVQSVDPEIFQKHLWDMFNVQFSEPLSLPQIDRIRWHIFPEIRIEPGQQSDMFDEPQTDDIETVIPDIVKVLDMQQELLARSLGDGHRVIHGVAGSGKTLILGYRCLYLAKLMHKPILVLCYNIALAASLRELMVERGVEDKVNVYHFHDWCGEQLRTYHIERPCGSGTDYITGLVANVIKAVKNGKIPRGQYGAVMIDEGHDFEPDWLQLVVQMVDPKSDSLLLLYDDAQSIYKTKNPLNFSLSSVGVRARGRTTVLKLNYRNTEEILSFAYRFAHRYLDPKTEDDDNIPVIQPQSAGRRGPLPIVKLFDSFNREATYIARIFYKLNTQTDVPWVDMCISYRKNWMGEILYKACSDQNIPVQWLHNSNTKKHYKPTQPSVKIMTMHSSKGLEFPVVAVAGVGYMPTDTNNSIVDAKLLYVAMTRATEKLLITGHQESEFLTQLQNFNCAEICDNFEHPSTI